MSKSGLSYKMTLLGDSGVGKTSLFKKLFTGKFDPRIISTIGVDKRSLNISINTDEGEKDVDISLFDTAGQERFRSLSDQFYKKADGALLVYDITRQDSFDEIKDYYYQKIQENCNKNIKIMVLGNKTDLEELRKIPPEVGANFAAEKGYLFMETSCFKNKTVAGGFQTLIELTYRERAPNMTEKNISINKNKHKNTKNKKGCC